MRKIEYRFYIKGQMIDRKLVEGTGIYVTGTGLFHGWGLDYEEFESGAGNYSIAIVEKENGEVIKVQVDDIKFLD